MASREVDVEIHGDVPARTAGAIADLIAEAYRRLASPQRAALEVRLVDTRERMAALAAAEKARHGIATVGDEAFACAHDAFEDRPRITVCVEALGPLQPPAIAALRHEVGHAVLHGRREFYQVRADAALRRAGGLRGLNDPALLQLLFFVAVAVKDWEVSRLLLQHGWTDDVRALAWELLEPSEEDRMGWRLAEASGGLRLLWAGSQLKPLLHAAPLRESADASEVEVRAAAMVHYLPAPARSALVTLAWRIAGELGEDTPANIACAAALLLGSDL